MIYLTNANVTGRSPPCRTRALPRPGLALGVALLGVLAGCNGGSSTGAAASGPSGGTTTYTLGGTITGLTATGLTLTNGSQSVSPAADATTFTFPTALASGAAYAVTVSAQPTGLTCSVTNGSGTIASANVTSVQVKCAANNLTGTAATGSPLSGATVTLIDSTGAQVTAQTDSSGNYSLSTSGMTPPFLVKVVTASPSPNGYPAGTTFYSVSDQSTPSVINVTPLTDLIIRDWYAAQSPATTVDAAFANPKASPPPTAAEVQLIQAVVLDIVKPVLQLQGVSTVGLDLISAPFTANGSGVDGALDQIKPVVYNGSDTSATVTIDTTSSVTQTSTVTTSSGSTQVLTSTTNGSGTVSSSVISSAVPTNAAEASALAGVEATLNSLAGVFNAKGAALTASDVSPFIDPNFLNGGATAAVQAQQIVNLAAAGQTINSFTITGIASYDPTNNLIGVVGTVNAMAGGVSVANPIGLGANVGIVFKEQSNGGWLLYGDQQQAKTQAWVISQTQNDISSTTTFTQLFVLVQAPAVSATPPCASADVTSAEAYPATAINGSINGTPTTMASSGYALQADPTVYQGQAGGGGAGSYSCEFTDAANGFFDLPAGSLPGVVGDTVNFSLNGGSQVPTLARTIGGYTTETINFTNLTGHALTSLQLGQPMTVQWTLPVTFPVYQIQFDAEEYVANGTGGYVSCNVTPATYLGTTSTSLTLTLPASCNGIPIASNPTSGAPRAIQMTVRITGTHGEVAAAYWAYN